MRQSDFYKKKNFANPNIFQNSSSTATTNERNMPVPTKPQPRGDRPNRAERPDRSDQNERAERAEKPERQMAERQERPERPPVQERSEANESPNNVKDNDTEKDKTEELNAGHLYKHPLQHTWTLWYKDTDQSKSWKENLNEIESFDTVEDFWSLYNHIKPPSEINIGSDYSLFKKGIWPMWEDEGNKRGGAWLIQLKQSKQLDADSIWLDVLLCLIGEAFEDSEEICGATINVRKLNKIKIGLWTSNGTHSDAILRIGRTLKEALRLGQCTYTYSLHTDIIVKQGSNAKSIYNI